jgi:hypothetical protein
VIVCGAIVPHAPVLLEALQPSLEEGRRMRGAVENLDLSKAETVVVISPHGAGAGVYGGSDGSLSGFGIEGLAASRPWDLEVARSLAKSWGRPLLETRLDYGVVVPLLLGLGGDLPVVGVGLPEVTGPGARPLSEVLNKAGALARALDSVAADRPLAVAASAHSSAALSMRAPLTEIAGAREIDAEVADALERDSALIEPLLEPLHHVGGACGVGPLATVAELVRGWRSEGLTRTEPYGVGYLVGRWAS